ncbi:hypothetical protein PVAG01_10801 [Phlyctema vagabunda]|uniref:DUF4139 domain-containing protein n=1 Tax=Phlyctema vagabunda TaxID=108571 RepID=A0ABR4P3E8_9HELO
MTSEAVHQQEFRIRDLSTRSVVLFPTRAHIVRDIKEIALQPGQNQIIIDGLGPTVDEHSIKVDGTGAATITDLAVELLPNRDIYEEIYPSDSDDESDLETDTTDTEDDAVKSVDETIKSLKEGLTDEKEKVSSAASRLALLENYSSSVKSSRPSDLDKVLSSYCEEREKVYIQHKSSTEACQKIQLQITKQEKEKRKISKAVLKAGEKARKERLKEVQKKIRRRQEAHKEKERIKAERTTFWPKKVYRVIITVEPSNITPGSSRRGSVSTETSITVKESSDQKPTESSAEISISLSYITYSASWSPRYDLTLNTIKSAGVLDYGAVLVNTTSETWTDAKVVLSTSQTTDQGFTEQMPKLHPWHVCLSKSHTKNSDTALYSRDEIAHAQHQYHQIASNVTKPRDELFGIDRGSHKTIQQASLFGNALYSTGNTKQQPRENTRSGGLFGSNRTQMLSRVSNPAMAPGRDEEDEECEEDEAAFEDRALGLFDEGLSNTMVNPNPALLFEEGSWEETGMTITYDVPGLRTLTPSNSTSKHKIAKVDFKNVVFSHIVIGKLRQVAYLNARIHNNSKITFLRGPLGLTLDGSFLGQTRLPRCSAGETFLLPLGIDPAITISYPKPTVRRSQSGIFNKEDSNIFNRSVSIINTKPNTAVDLTVLDQIPVSEDERLRIDVTYPRGLKVGGEKVPTGTGMSSGNYLRPAQKNAASAARESTYGSATADKGKAATKWGSANASIKKGGEVTWTVKLLPAQSVKLILEYEASFPGGESVVQT